MSNTYGECGEYVLNGDAMSTAADRIAVAADRVAVEADAAQVAADRVAVEISETNAANSAASAGTSNFKGNWSDLVGALNKPASVFHDDSYWNLLNDLADVTTSEPGVTSDWAIVIKKWVNQSVSFSAAPDERYQIDGSGGAVDAALATSYDVGTELIFHNIAASTNLVRLTNTALTINGTKGAITASDNLELEAGDTVHIVMKTTVIGEIV